MFWLLCSGIVAALAYTRFAGDMVSTVSSPAYGDASRYLNLGEDQDSVEISSPRPFKLTQGERFLFGQPYGEQYFIQADEVSGVWAVETGRYIKVEATNPDGQPTSVVWQTGLGAKLASVFLAIVLGAAFFFLGLCLAIMLLM